MFLLDVGGVVPVLVDEHGPAVGVEGLPEEGLVGEPEDEEVARGRRALAEGVGDGFDVGVGHFVGGVGGGGVVEEGGDYGLGIGGGCGGSGGGRRCDDGGGGGG